MDESAICPKGLAEDKPVGVAPPWNCACARRAFPAAVSAASCFEDDGSSPGKNEAGSPVPTEARWGLALLSPGMGALCLANDE